MKKKATIKDLAKMSGVSITAVSQILNGKGQRFSSKTRQNVILAKNKLNYIPNYNARSLVKKDLKTIGIIVPDIGNSFFSTLIKGIQEISKEENFLPLIFNSSHQSKFENYYLNKLVERNINGIIIASPLITAKAIHDILEKNNIPYLVLDQNSFVHGDRIYVDDFQGGKLVAKHLIELGHRDFIVVMPKKSPNNVDSRLQGFKNELNKLRDSFKLNVIYSSLTKDGGYLASKKILNSKKLIQSTAIFAIDDEIALGLYRGFIENNIKIPEDFSIVGYDDIEIDNYIFPKLTSVKQPTKEIGIQAAKLLIKRINNPKKNEQFIKLSVKLIIRNSTKSLAHY
ncbi:ribose utilization transcriptional repressor RbsR [Liquorilactobacillus vini]|uniref:ribose utilization transcriptional repressor RbsR n=3 Tax=Liquorilactobacillus vini TaxID=238015 RepID=UPI00029B11E7|nr:LacI family DNA-binding transcriptional regulator [Liquorilactobacillus vini]